MEDDLKLQDFDQWVKIFILKHEGENLSKESKILGHPNEQSYDVRTSRQVNIIILSYSLTGKV